MFLLENVVPLVVIVFALSVGSPAEKVNRLQAWVVG